MGLAHASGSVMRLFQAVTAYSEGQAASPGIMLRYHFRCVPRVIAYCNELVYRGQLIPLRSSVDPPRCHQWPGRICAEIAKGRAPLDECTRSGGDRPLDRRSSRRDRSRTWRPRREPDCRHYSLSRPTTCMQTALSRYLRNRPDDMIVDTVHALQGAQRRVVVFFPPGPGPVRWPVAFDRSSMLATTC